MPPRRSNRLLARFDEAALKDEDAQEAPRGRGRAAPRGGRCAVANRGRGAGGRGRGDEPVDPPPGGQGRGAGGRGRGAPQIELPPRGRGRGGGRGHGGDAPDPPPQAQQQQQQQQQQQDFDDEDELPEAPNLVDVMAFNSHMMSHLVPVTDSQGQQRG